MIADPIGSILVNLLVHNLGFFDDRVLSIAFCVKPLVVYQCKYIKRTQVVSLSFKICDAPFLNKVSGVAILCVYIIARRKYDIKTIVS